MTYPTIALNEREQEVNEALKTRDAEHVHRLADLYKREGYDEVAEDINNQARQIDKEDWAYDEFIGN
jgi:hypothetical protein